MLLCCAYVDIHIYNLLLYLSLCVYISIYIHGETEREREIKTSVMYIKTYVIDDMVQIQTHINTMYTSVHTE